MAVQQVQVVVVKERLLNYFNMKKTFLCIILVLFSIVSNGQKSIDQILKKYNDESIPYMSVSELKENQDSIYILDAREEKEYKVSHIKNATFVGHTEFDISSVDKKNIPKNAEIVVYCSIGVRSEQVSKKLKEAGYTNVCNLYGGIFEWKNNNNQVLDSIGESTEKVHTYSKEWSKWLRKGKKVY